MRVRTQPERLSPLTPLAKSSVMLAAGVGIAARDLAQGDLGFLALMLVGLAVVGLVAGSFSWWRTRFWIEGAELRIDGGLLTLTSTIIKLDRVQSVELHRPLTARLLGLAQLRLEVAGGSSDEADLAFLSLPRAKDFKATLLRAKAEVTTPLDDAPSAVDGVAQPEAHDAVESAVTVPVSTLLASQSRTIEAAGLVLAVGLGLAGLIVVNAAWATALAVPLGLGSGSVIAARIARGYRQQVEVFADRLEVTGGLLTTSNQVIRRDRVQGIVLIEPLTWRGTPWCRLQFASLGVGVINPESDRTVLVVVIAREDAERVIAALTGPVPARERLVRAPKRAVLLDPVSRGFHAAGHDQHHVVSVAGWFTRRTHIVELARVQAIRVIQGPLQRRLKLADLWLEVPLGPARAHLRLRDAAQLDAERAALLRSWRVARAQKIGARQGGELGAPDDFAPCPTQE